MNALVNGRDRRGRKGANVDGLPSVQSLNRWLTAHDRCPLPSAVADQGIKLWHPMALEYFSRPQKPTVTWVQEQIAARWQPAFGPKPPSYDAVARYFREQCSQLVQIQGRHSGNALRSRTAYTQRDWAGHPPFFEVHADGWATHFLVPIEKTGQWQTLEVWHFRCVRTRYVTPFGIGYSENRDVILQGLRECIRVGGVPALWRTDSTGSVKNRAVAGVSKGAVKAAGRGFVQADEDMESLCARLGITWDPPQTVGNSQANGIAEQFNTYLDAQSKVLATYMNPGSHDEKTFVKVRRLLDQLETACRRAGAIGATDEDRARPVQLRLQIEQVGKGHVFADEAEARTWLLGLVDQWNHAPHASLPKRLDLASGKKRHMTPAEALAEALAELHAQGKDLHFLADAVADDLFRPHLRRKVVRGAVTLHNSQRYLCAELAHIEGSEVLVVPYEADAHQVQIKDVQGRLIAVAQLQVAKGRAETTMENAERRRAEARIRHKEQQIAQIERELAPPAIEHAPTGAALSGVWPLPIEIPAADMVANVVEGQARVIPELRAGAPTPSGRAAHLMPPRRPLAPHEDPEVIAQVMRDLEAADARRDADMAARMARWHADVAAKEAAKATQQQPPADPSFDRASAG